MRPAHGDEGRVLEPTAVLPRGTAPPDPGEPPPPGPPPAPPAPAGRPGSPVPGGTASAAAAPPPAPRVLSVGEIPGLSPRRRRGPGRSVGEVPAANVDLVDRLPRPPDGHDWPTVAAWLQSLNAATTRRGYLHCVAAFLRWLELAAPGTRLLEATEDDLAAYKDQISSGSGAAARLLKNGRPLGVYTVAQRISALRSLYAYALRRHVIDRDPSLYVDPSRTPKIGLTSALSLPEADALMSGAEAIAAQDRQDAVAVALLLHLGLRTGELEALPFSAFDWDRGHRVARFRVKGGKVLPVVIVPRVRALLEPLLRDRAGEDYLLQYPDGRPWNRDRVTTALRRAARAAGFSAEQVDALTPHVLRATAVTLLLGAGMTPHKVAELTGQSLQTVLRYDRSGIDLNQHAAHHLARLLAGDA